MLTGDQVLTGAAGAIGRERMPPVVTSERRGRRRLGRLLLMPLLFGITTALASSSAAQEVSGDAAELTALERALADGLHRKDGAALDRLLAPGFVLRGNPDVSRETWLANAVTYCWGDTSDIAGLQVVPSEDMAVATFSLTFFTNPLTCEPQTSASLITDIWTRIDGQWRLLVRHSAPLPVEGADVIQQQFAKMPEPPPVLEGAGELSFVSTGGNSDTRSLGTGGELTWRPGAWTTALNAAFVSADTEGVNSARSLAVDGRESYRLSPRVELYGHGGYYRDLFAGIESRVTADGGVAFVVLGAAPHELRLDVGAGHVYEDRLREPVSRFAASTVVADYTWTISARSTLTDRAAFTASLEESADWRFSNALALTLELNRIFALKVSLASNYLNQPVAGFRKLDTVTSIALVAAFARRAEAAP